MMLVVAVVAAILAAREEAAKARERQVAAEVEQLAKALAKFESKQATGWGCRGPAPPVGRVR
jgi:hypothetical protein